jgi:hypothetical protein
MNKSIPQHACGPANDYDRRLVWTHGESVKAYQEHGQYVLEDALRKIAVGTRAIEQCQTIAIDAFAALAKIDGWTRLSEKQPADGQYCRWFVPTNLFNAHGAGTYLPKDVKIKGEVVSAFAGQNLDGSFWLPKEKICWKEMP